MTGLIAEDDLYAKKVSEGFSQQEVMRTIGVNIVSIEPGKVELKFAHNAKLTQQHGFIHGGIVTTVLDSACGYAAFSLMPKDSAVLTVEFKTNFMSPARGDEFHAIGYVKKAGKTITVADGELCTLQNDQKKLVATMTATLIAIPNRE